MSNLLRRLTLVALVLLSALAIIPTASAWSDSLTKKSVVCDPSGQTKLVTVTYKNLEPNQGLFNSKNVVSVQKVNNVSIPFVNVASGGGTADFTVAYPGTQNGSVTVTLFLKWAFPLLGNGFGSDTISVNVPLGADCETPPAQVTICHKPGTPAEQTMTIPVPALGGHLGHGDYLGECEENEEEPPVIEEPPVTPTPPQINRQGICVLNADGSVSFRDITAEEYEGYLGSGGLPVLVSESGAISCDFPNTVVIAEPPVVTPPAVAKKPKAKPPVRVVKTKPPVVKVVKSKPAKPAAAPRPAQAPYTL